MAISSSSSSLSIQIPSKTLAPRNSQPTVKIVSFSSFKRASQKISHPNNKTLTTCSTAAPLSAFSTVPASGSASDKLRRLISEFQALPLPLDRVKRLLEYASNLPPFPDFVRTASNRVMGCTSQVFLIAELVEGTTVRFMADSDSEITKGFCACLISVLNGATPEEVMGMTVDDFEDLKLVGMNGMANSRANSWMNILIAMQKRTRMLIAEKEGRLSFDLFPSLVIGEVGIEAKGSYAEAQAKFLSPDKSKIQELVKVLKEKKIGVVAHFYMDPEVQGVLTAAQKLWPHIYISDSLVMADTAVKMAEAGCQYITVLGVDFMSENVRAILDQAGFDKVGVYRMSNEQIGCSLADAAESSTYMNFLKTASSVHPSLHVIYINTSLQTKAHGHELVPTITCTSSNVVQTILQAFAQIPDVHIWYGPDSYMGANISELFRQMSNMTDEQIALVHPKHNRTSIKSVLPRLHYYREGACIVHDMFGHEVVDKIKDLYNDAFLTAHFEVPGEMFSLAMEAKKRGMGVVGSTKNILDFITDRVKEALVRNTDENLQFVLGTESGMITSIVAAVQNLLRGKNTGIKVEIVFPVCSDSISRTADSSAAAGLDSVTIVPGVTSGEGCSIHGGCASCPYMKMNTLHSLLNICSQLPDKENSLTAYQAGRFNATTPLGKSVAEVGCEPILHMRHFQGNGSLPEKLVHQILKQPMNGADLS